MPTLDSNPEDSKNSEPQTEVKLNAPELLIGYLCSQFEAAYQKERNDDRTGNTAENGSFYQRKVLLDSDDNPTVQSTIRIVMRPPFSTTSSHEQKDFAEIYAVFLRDEAGNRVIDDGGVFADVFLIRTYDGSEFTAFELADDNGCTPIDLSDLSLEAELNLTNLPESAEKEIDDIFAPIKKANELLNKLETYNIVPTND